MLHGNDGSRRVAPADEPETGREPAPVPRTTPRHARVSAPAIVHTCVLVLTLVSASIGASGCGDRGGDSAANAQTQRRGGGPPGAGKQGPARPPVPVAVEEVTLGDIASTYTTTATLGAEKEAEVVARVSGVVEAVRCEEGDLVKEGQELLRIDNDAYRLELDMASAKRASLESRYERVQDMLSKQLVSPEEYETVKNDLQLSQSEEEIARLELSYARVRAPFAGRVVSRLIDHGANISVGTPLFLLSDFDPLLAEVHVPAREFKRIQTDQPVELVLDSNATRLSGRIKLISPVIDPNSGTIKLTIEVSEYPEGTRPGDFAEVHIVTEQRTGRPLVPKSAVVTEHGERVVFVAAADSTAERRVVEVGFEDDLRAEILAGVESGELVVVKGQRSLKHGQPIKVMDADAALEPKTPAAEAGGQRRGGRRGRRGG